MASCSLEKTYKDTITSYIDALPTPWGTQMRDPNASPKQKTMEEQGVGAHSLIRNTWKG
jgi:hypothetical protein